MTQNATSSCLSNIADVKNCVTREIRVYRFTRVCRICTDASLCKCDLKSQLRKVNRNCKQHFCLVQDRSGRIRQRNRKLAQVRRQAELEAFKLERQREQVNYERQKLMPRSRSDSPRCRSQEELRTESPDPNAEIPLAPIYAR